MGQAHDDVAPRAAQQKRQMINGRNHVRWRVATTDDALGKARSVERRTTTTRNTSQRHGRKWSSDWPGIWYRTFLSTATIATRWYKKSLAVRCIWRRIREEGSGGGDSCECRLANILRSPFSWRSCSWARQRREMTSTEPIYLRLRVALSIRMDI